MKYQLKIVLALATLYCTASFCYRHNNKLNIVVAANMKPAMDSIISIYTLRNPGSVIQPTYGSSGKFYEQISNGAPFDLFFSADMNYPTNLKNNNLTVSSVKLYAIGRLALWSKKLNPNLSQMNSLTDDRVKKISVANPATAPYGAKAIESLKYYKIYDKIKPNLVYGENIAQAAQFVAFGVADVGIISLSECLNPNMKKENGKYWIIPQNSYSALEQGAVILKRTKNGAEANNFFNFIFSETAQNILTHYGYGLPTISKP